MEPKDTDILVVISLFCTIAFMCKAFLWLCKALAKICESLVLSAGFEAGVLTIVFFVIFVNFRIFYWCNDLAKK